MEKFTTDNEKFWKRGWMRKALDIIEVAGGKDDIDRVRKALDEDAVDPRRDDIDFLQRFGSFEDIIRVCKIDSDYRSAGAGSMLLNYVRDRHRVARTILTLAKDNIVNLLASGLHDDMVPSVIAECKHTSFRALSGGQLDELLYHSSDNVRKAAALKTLIVYSSNSINEKRDHYLTANRPYFYNVIFWLDLSGAFPVALVREIARAELRKVD